jgi:hypothetical protein
VKKNGGEARTEIPDEPMQHLVAEIEARGVPEQR